MTTPCRGLLTCAFSLLHTSSTCPHLTPLHLLWASTWASCPCMPPPQGLSRSPCSARCRLTICTICTTCSSTGAQCTWSEAPCPHPAHALAPPPPLPTIHTSTYLHCTCQQTESTLPRSQVSSPGLNTSTHTFQAQQLILFLTAFPRNRSSLQL